METRNSGTNVSASDTLTPVEAYACTKGQTACPQLSISGTVICDIGATVIFTNTAGFLSRFIEEAFTFAAYTNGSSNCAIDEPSGIMRCNWNAQPWCTPETTPPDHNITFVRDFVPIYSPTFWDTWAICTRLGSGDPWLCSPINKDNALKLTGNINLPRLTCDKNP
jgi:hypothetical protein